MVCQLVLLLMSQSPSTEPVHLGESKESTVMSIDPGPTPAAVLSTRCAVIRLGSLLSNEKLTKLPATSPLYLTALNVVPEATLPESFSEMRLDPTVLFAVRLPTVATA